MNNVFKKAFNLSDISYSWVLLISMGGFLASLFYSKLNPNPTAAAEWTIYGSSVAAAVAWGIINYIDHIRLGAAYKNYDNLNAFVESLIMSKDEKAELKTYLEDYVKDLISQGKTAQEATKIAINQFRVQEFNDISKNNSLIDLPIHHYLIGCTLLALLAALVLRVIISITSFVAFWIYAIIFTLVLYGIGFIALYFLYKIVDSILTNKFNK